MPNLRSYQDQTRMRTTVVFDEHATVIANAMLEEIVHKMVDQFFEDHYDEVRKQINMVEIGEHVTKAIADKIGRILEQEFGKDENREALKTKRIINGLCPECGENWRNNKDIDGHQPFYPEFAASLDDRNVDRSTGHKKVCSLGR